jgi:hypothetical protein
MKIVTKPPMDEVIAEYKRLGSLRLAGKHFGVSSHTIQRWMIKAGIPRDNRSGRKLISLPLLPRQEAGVAELAAHYAILRSLSLVAKLHALPTVKVRRRLINAGYDTRLGWEARPSW